MINIVLDNNLRTPGIDHLVEYRDSVFYPLFKKGVKERGNAYEQIAIQALESAGYKVEENKESHGAYDLIVDGKKVELKGSRKPSPYDTRNRKAQFSYISKEAEFDTLMLLFVNPDDTVDFYTTTVKRVEKYLKPQNGSWNLAKHPKEIDTDHILTVKVN